MLDEFDIESYKLKPINSGLGFHEKKTPAGKGGTRAVPKTALEKRFEREKRMAGNDALKAFYEIPDNTIKKSARPVAAKKSEVEAKGYARFAGWLIDLAFVGLIGSIAIFGLALLADVFAGISVETVMMAFSNIESMASVGILFVITYLLYFTYGDMETSWGKKILGIKLVAKSGRLPSSKMTLVRSLTTLFSLCLLGIPSLFDCQGKLSNTKIVRE